MSKNPVFCFLFCGTWAPEHRLTSCGACDMWDLPGPGLEPVSPALAGGFSATVPPGESPPDFLWNHSRCLQCTGQLLWFFIFEGYSLSRGCVSLATFFHSSSELIIGQRVEGHTQDRPETTWLSSPCHATRVCSGHSFMSQEQPCVKRGGYGG